jgi:hypothetical protein
MTARDQAQQETKHTCFLFAMQHSIPPAPSTLLKKKKFNSIQFIFNALKNSLVDPREDLSKRL